MEDRFELVRGTADYPEILEMTPSPPAVLYGRGDPAGLRPGLAIIGARRATPTGIDVTSTLASWAASAGYVIVSGGAYGCDQAAHRGALSVLGVTVAVLGCGADVAYPASARALFDEIVMGHGVVVSEHPWGTRPQPWMFRKRNRIIAGLAAAVLVVEAGLPSGTFSTADAALAAGRTVLAVPGSVLSPHSRGSNRLIREGAIPVTDASDLRDELAGLLGPPRDALTPCEHVGGERSRDPVLSAIRATPGRPDDVARDLGTDVVSVIRALGRLERENLVARHYDGTYHATAPR